MKKIIAILLVIIMTLSMAACQPSNAGGINAKIDPDEMGMEMGSTYSDYDGVSVQISNAFWGEDGFVLEVDWINKTLKEGIFGASYIIERKEGEEWVSCQTVDDLTFIALAYVLSPLQTREETYHVSRMFDVSKAGTYRFRSDFSIDDKNNQTVWAEFTLSSDIDESQIKTQEPVDYGVQYIRTNGYMEGAAFPHVVIIRSLDELNNYYEANKETFDLERKDKVYSDTTIGFLDACDKYDAEYFEKGYLVFVLLEEGSGSIRHEVTGSTISSDGELGVYIDTIVPEVGTDDMAEWHIILEMSNAVAVKDENAVQVYLDGTLTFDKGAVAKPVSGSQGSVMFREPPDAKLLHGNGSTPLNRAGYSWHYPNGDGTMAAVIADSLHALDCKDILNPIYVTGDYVKLAFEDDPDSVEVRCWPDTAWNTNAEPESVNCYDTAFDLKQGGYIYEIIAMWNESEVAHFGSVSYYAYITTEKEHDHQVASEPQTVDGPVVGYCGNTQTTLYIDGEAYTFMYDESVTLTDILLNLDYDPNKLCKCLPEYTVDTEFGKGYGINLTDGYARCNKGQADLTAGQLDQIRSIIEWAKKEKPGK